MRRKAKYDMRAYVTPLQCFALSEAERVEVVNLVSAYTGVVNEIVGAIWEMIHWSAKWEHRHIVSDETLNKLPSNVRKLLEWRSWVKRIIPQLPRKRNALKTLRSQFIESWTYNKHFVDGALKDAWSIPSSWRSNYVRGVRKRRKPLVRRRFARFKTTMLSWKHGVLKLSVRPRRFIRFDVRGLWWLPRAKEFLGHSVTAKSDFGEVLVSEERLIVSVRKKRHQHRCAGRPVVGWDNNLLSVDGFSPSSGFGRASLKKAYTLHVTYSNKRRRIQQKLSKKKRVYSRLVEKYEGRERNRVAGELHRTANEVLRKYEGYSHVFEDTGKRGIFSRSRRRNREISAVDWKRVSVIVGYKATVNSVSAWGTTMTCPRCGGKNMVPPIADAEISCRCGLVRNRQRGAAFNIWLKGSGLFPRGKRVRKSKVQRRLQLIQQWKEELQKPSASIEVPASTVCQ
nr:zinc ribbon domain-containing protein [Candidatus Njordarchaeota archaeon]